MIKRTVLTVLSAALALTVSCASASAKQPATLEPIENLAKPGVEAPVLSETADAAHTIEAAEIAEAAPLITGGSVKRHLGAVLTLSPIPSTTYFVSGDEYGFVTRHEEGTGDTWQVSDLPIRRIAVHPEGNLIAVYESDGFTVHRISLWNWSEKRRIYAKRFKDSVLSLSWSAKGTWLLVGNSSLEGITALDGATGNPVNLFASQPGMVSYAVTGKTETSIMTFGPSGRLVYTDLSTGAARASYQGPADISEPRPLNNNRAIAGIIDGSMNVIDATSGKTLAWWESSFPALLPAAAETDTAPYWLEHDIENCWFLRHGDLKSQAFEFPAGSNPVSSMVLGEHILFGASDGGIYALSSEVSPDALPIPEPVDSSPVRRIDDAVSDGERLFILTEGAVLISAGPGKAPLFAFDGIEGNRIALTEGLLLFWSDLKAAPVSKTSLDGEMREILYSPTEPVTAFNTIPGKIALIEGSSKVTVLDMSSGITGVAPFNYRGIGLQDILIISADSVVVTKSATARAPNPVVKIDTRTGETVPYKIEGNLCYGIKPTNTDATGFTGFIVGSADSGSITRLVTVTGLDTLAGIAPPVKTEASYADEDLAASAQSDGSLIYTNLGKGSLVEIDSTKGTVRRFQRGYALPKRIVLMDRWAVTINHDGSVSWLTRAGMLESTSSITTDGYWKEE